MNWLDVLSVVTIALLVVVLVGMGRMGWRIWRGNEPMDPGGSMGDQMLGAKNSSAFVKRSRRTPR
jgi:hypothetical protein